MNNDFISDSILLFIRYFFLFVFVTWPMLNADKYHILRNNNLKIMVKVCETISFITSKIHDFFDIQTVFYFRTSGSLKSLIFPVFLFITISMCLKIWYGLFLVM